MKRLKLALLAAAASVALTAPAAAQMDHSKMPGMNMPAPKKPAAKKAPTKKPAAKKPAAKKSAPRRAPATKPSTATAVDPHAGHDTSQMPAQQQQPATPMPAMPGHDMSQMPGMTTPPGQQAPGTEAATGTSLPAGNAPPPPLPTEWAADRIFGTPGMAEGRHHLQQFHGGQKLVQVLFNVAEYHIRAGRDAFEWDGEGWYGGDINRLWVKTEGEGTVGGALETFEVQALYNRAIGPYFNIQGGLRYDFRPNPSRAYAVIGVEGLAPSFFDVEGALFLSNKGELMARAEGWYDQRITQRLILQPRAEVDFAAQSSRDIGVGSGLSSGEIGLRLRYDIRREFAPYIGVQYRRAFGATRRFRKAEGEEGDGWAVLTGIRFWF